MSGGHHLPDCILELAVSREVLRFFLVHDLDALVEILDLTTEHNHEVNINILPESTRPKFLETMFLRLVWSVFRSTTDESLTLTVDLLSRFCSVGLDNTLVAELKDALKLMPPRIEETSKDEIMDLKMKFLTDQNLKLHKGLSMLPLGEKVMKGVILVSPSSFLLRQNGMIAYICL